jgi:hypothetical protein
LLDTGNTRGGRLISCVARAPQWQRVSSADASGAASKRFNRVLAALLAFRKVAHAAIVAAVGGKEKRGADLARRFPLFVAHANQLDLDFQIIEPLLRLPAKVCGDCKAGDDRPHFSDVCQGVAAPVLDRLVLHLIEADSHLTKRFGGIGRERGGYALKRSQELGDIVARPDCCLDSFPFGNFGCDDGRCRVAVLDDTLVPALGLTHRVISFPAD